MKDGNLGKEWMEKFNEEMKRSTAPKLMELSEQRALMEVEAAKLLEQNHQFRHGQLLELEKLQKEQNWMSQRPILINL